LSGLQLGEFGAFDGNQFGNRWRGWYFGKAFGKA